MEKAAAGYLNRKDVKRALGIPGACTVMPKLLAQGECNRNFLFLHPETGKKLVLRVNLVSQMHLSDQIGYEYRALKAIEASGRTPRALYIDPAPEGIGYGLMVYEYLPGRPLCYDTDLSRAASVLADIHSTEVDPEKCGLLSPKEPLSAILAECREMFRVYEASALCNTEKREQIRRMLCSAEELLSGRKPYEGYRCCINTELNSGNFLMAEEVSEAASGRRTDYLIDWEKPLYGDPVQDLGHFLAPTTTFWKTDTILSKERMLRFLSEYRKAVGGRFDTDGMEERFQLYLPVTCMRGLCWCAMAFVQYRDPDSKAPKNPSAERKIEAYLEKNFLDMIERNWFL